MAKTVEKKRGTTERQGSRFGEIVGILIILLAILLTLALISYKPSDPSLQTVTGQSPSNFVGQFGSYLAAGLLDAVGYGAYFLPLICLFFSYFFFTDRKWEMKLNQAFGYVAFLISFCAFLHLFRNSPAYVDAGGVLGALIGDVLSDLFGKVGAYLVILALFLISLVITFNLRFTTAGQAVGAKVAHWATTGWEWIQAQVGKRKEKPEAKPETSEPVIHGSGAKNPVSKPKPKPKPEPEPETDFPVTPEPTPLPKATVRDISGKVKVAAPAQRPEPAAQIEFVGFTGNYQYPPVDLLEDHTITNQAPERETLVDQSRILEGKLSSFKIEGKVVEVHPGPVITMFEFEPAPGIKVAQVANRDDDLAMALRAESIRIVAPIPGKGAIGIEIPNRNREIVSLRELVQSEKFQKFKGHLPVVFGKDISGRAVVADLARMPHLLVAGTTGSGKSVFVNSLICSLLYRCSPAELRMLMVDPKMLELADYADIPHLLHPVVTDPRKAAAILRWAVGEMEERYRNMAEMGVRNIENYNAKVVKINEGKAKRPTSSILDGDSQTDPEPLIELPFVLVVIDEFADLMMVAAKEVEENVTRLAQMARAAGIHLVLATQRPSVDVITGVIKANFPARISFKVSSKIDSRTILDQGGADSLLGAGDMLFSPPTSSKIARIHGPFITENEIQDIVEFLKQSGGPQYDQRIIEAGEKSGNENGIDGMDEPDDEEEELVERAWEIIRSERKASISYIQRRMKIGYNKAARIIEVLERRGFIAPSDGTSRPRQILIPDENGMEP
jgi:DNA segregation ATPase FtsK/SpoIIIE, S-DNA-T family